MTTEKVYVTKKQLFAATLRNDEPALKHYVEKIRISLKSRNSEKQTAAHIAATNRNLGILKYLLNADDSVLDYRDIDGKNLLHVAAEQGSLDTVRYLVDEMGADVTATNHVHANNTPLHIAAEYGHLPVLRFLVDEKKVNVDARNDAGETAVFLAAEKPYTDVIAYLAEVANANLTTTDAKNEHVLFVSARVGDLQVPKYLLETLKVDIDVNWKDAFGYTLAHTAARFNQLPCLKYFVEGRGAEIDIVNEAGWTPLHEAASAGYLDVVQYLLERGANANSKSKAGKTAFHVAGDKKVKKYLKEVSEKRDRRNVLLQLRPLTEVTPMAGGRAAISEIPYYVRISARSDGSEGGSTISIESSPPHTHVQLLLGLLTLAKTITKRGQPFSFASSGFAVDEKADPSTIDAVSGAFGFGECRTRLKGAGE